MKVKLVKIEELREHEMVEKRRLDDLKRRILEDGVLFYPIVVEKNTRVILDGHHRYNVLKEIGCKEVPVVEIDYTNVRVESWRKGEIVTKLDVLLAGLTGRRLPPRTSRHLIKKRCFPVKLKKLKIGRT